MSQSIWETRKGLSADDMAYPFRTLPVDTVELQVTPNQYMRDLEQKATNACI